MIRKAMLTLGVMSLTVSGFAQGIGKCASDAFLQEQKAMYPNIATQKAALEKDIRNAMRSTTASNPRAKTTKRADYTCWADDVYEFHIPVVVHVIYDFAAPGNVSISDNEIYGLIDRLNKYYNMLNADLSGIIPTWKPWIGNAHITFHLANKDPQNKPTRGIVRTYSYLTVGGDESAKLNPWPPDQYLNIFLENVIGRGAGKGTVLAYATFPESYSDNPYSQGVISRTDQGLANPGFGDVSTIAHEIGHFLSLEHPWATNGQEVEGTTGLPITCGDDEVDDTPPTIGHFSCSNAKLYDTLCATNYFRNYDSIDYFVRTCTWDSLGGKIDYPDTTNTQNIMDYSACNNQMFTKGQVARMRATLRSNIGFRSHLVDSANLRQTGILDASNNFASSPDIAPTAMFSVNRVYVCADQSTTVTFTNRTYNDTATVDWTFGGGSSNPTSTSTNTVVNNFSTPGWVEVNLTATSNAGTSTITRKDMLYTADLNRVIDPNGYYEDFNQGSGSDVDRYPIFNYYGTDHKWELVNNAGVYDNTSIRFANYDNRGTLSTSNATATPGGIYSDFFTPPFDLSGFGPVCNLSFFTAGAYRTSLPSKMNDALTIAASVDCGVTWKDQDTLTGGELANNGLVADPFTPAWNQWKEQAVAVSSNTGRSSHTLFRFRFKSGTDYPTASGFSFGTGNNFYLDRLRISNAPLGVVNGVIVNLSMNVVPNPTNGAATVKLNGGDNSIADLSVTDVTGKLVYRTSVKRTSATTKIEIPAENIAVKGMYLVKVVTNGATETQKLVVY